MVRLNKSACLDLERGPIHPRLRRHSLQRRRRRPLLPGMRRALQAGSAAERLEAGRSWVGALERRTAAAGGRQCGRRAGEGLAGSVRQHEAELTRGCCCGQAGRYQPRLSWRSRGGSTAREARVLAVQPYRTSAKASSAPSGSASRDGGEGRPCGQQAGGRWEGGGRWQEGGANQSGSLAGKGQSSQSSIVRKRGSRGRLRAGMGPSRPLPAIYAYSPPCPSNHPQTVCTAAQAFRSASPHTVCVRLRVCVCARVCVQPKYSRTAPPACAW